MALTAEAGVIRGLHRRLCKAVEGLLGLHTSVHEGAGWQHAGEHQRITFGLTNPHIPDFAPLVRAGRTWPVMPLFPEQAEDLQECAWAGWSELWLGTGRRVFALDGVQWSFYWGNPGRPKRLLFRAGWVAADLRAAKAPQPHWHFDSRTVWETTIPVDTEASLEVVEVRLECPPEGGPSYGEAPPSGVPALLEYDLSGLHLGMGGWDHPGEHPACWQWSPHSVDALVEWAARTLCLARAEFDRLRTTTVT